jgi:N-acetylglucosaminyldiphosphoundecaprenol N-acetyl-beta-D-mannosaminyltransferase
MERRRPAYMTVVNASKVAAAGRDEELRRIIENADLITADGMSVVWASRLIGKPLKERVTGVDLFQAFAERAAAHGWPIFLLGAREASVKGAVETLASRHPSLRIAGYRNGYFDPAESPAIAESIRRSGAAILFVAMGSPGQERWIAEHLGSTGVRFALGVGGSFDHVSGLAARAPRWMQRAGLEWLYRLMREPRRLWRRYLVGNTVFVWRVLRQIMRGEGA